MNWIDLKWTIYAKRLKFLEKHKSMWPTGCWGFRLWKFWDYFFVFTRRKIAELSHFFHLFLTERCDAHEWHCWLANPRYPKRYQPADPQGEDFIGRAVHERRAGQELYHWQQHFNRWKGKLQQTQQQQQSGAPTLPTAYQQHQKLLTAMLAAMASSY